MGKYTVKLNGTEIPVREVTVSAMPFNKVWDGKQRSKDQTETGYYVSFDMDKPIKIEITVNDDFGNFEIRPFEFELKTKRIENTVEIEIDNPMQFTFEPFGRHSALHIFANVKPEKPSGDIIYYGKGEHVAGLIELKSGQTLYVDEGAVVYGMIYAQDACDIKIMGRGILSMTPYRRSNDFGEDGREIYDEMKAKGIIGNEFEDLGWVNDHFDDVGKACANMALHHCKNVYVEGIVFEDSPFWSVIVRNGCENIVMDNIKIIGQWRYNSDGIDICTSKNVTIKNCFIRSFDDCFVARGRHLVGETEDVENVTVENCVLWCDWGIALEIWNGRYSGEIRNVQFKNNYIVHLSAVAMDITTWYGSAESVISNILFKNIYIDGDDIYMNPAIESAETPVYVFKEGFIPWAVKITAQKIGKSTGNQGFEAVDDYSEFNVSYNNIIFRNVKYSGKELNVLIEEQEGLLKISNILAENCDFKI